MLNETIAAQSESELYETIVSQSKSELFVEKIQDLILSGKLKVGDRLPTERELANSMGISNGIVHLGISELARMGFLKIVPRHGIYVTNFSETGTVETLNAILKYNGGKFDKKNTKDLFEFFEANEGYVVRNLSKLHTPEDISKLHEFVDNLLIAKSNKASSRELAELYFQFHRQLISNYDNSFFVLIINAFKPISITYYEMWIQQQEIDEAVKKLHHFVDLIDAGNPEKASKYLSVITKDLFDEISSR